MKYLLIAFVIAMVISPVLWLRQSPGQARITAFRNRALQLGMKVQIVPLADAAETERSPDAVRYLRPFLPDPAGQMPVIPAPWTLLHNSRRGRESPWPQWRWFRTEAPSTLQPAIAECLALMPDSVTALRADNQGLSVYWFESGKIEAVNQVSRGLDGLFAALAPDTTAARLYADPGSDNQAQG